MKKIKKIVSMMLTLAMVFSLGMTALASDYTITVENATVGQTYNAYKIFDATYSESGGVSYTIDRTSAWYETIVNLTTDEGEDVFTLTAIAGTDSYYVTAAVSDEEVIAALKSVEIPNGAVAATSGQATSDGSLILDVGAPGYYYVTSSLGAVVSIDTAHPTATIIDKNQTPGDLHKYIVDSDGNKYDAVEDGMDEDVNFDVTAHVPLYDGENVVTEYIFTDTLSNGMLIELTTDQFYSSADTTGTHYYLNDVLINSWITLGDEGKDFTDQVYNYTFELVGYDTYTDATTGETYHTFSGFVLTYYTYDKDTYVDGEQDTFDTSNYPINADIEIKYTAHVTSLEGYDNTNDIEMDWYVTSWRNPTPEEPDEGDSYGDHNDVYSWELELVKVDGDGTETPLEGATFTLQSDNMQSVVVGHSYAYVLVSDLNNATDGKVTVGDKEYYVVDFETTDYYQQADDTYGLAETDNGPYHRILTDKTTTVTESSHLAQGTTDASGKLYFGGLGSGDYVLTEIVAPDGYNLLSDPIEFTINWTEDGGFTVTMKSTGITNSMSDHYVLTMTVANNQGTELPGTGGMGTTIFYVLGAILVCGAVVLLITRRRMSR